MAWCILFHLIFPATIWHKFCKKNLCSNSYHYFVPKNLHMPYGISLYLLQCCHFPALLEISVKPHLFFFITTWQNNKVAYSGAWFMFCLWLSFCISGHQDLSMWPKFAMCENLVFAEKILGGWELSFSEFLFHRM